MELKDVILSTLAEMEEEIPAQTINNISSTHKEPNRKKIEPKVVHKEPTEKQTKEVSSNTLNSEFMYLSSIRDRLLVLFEGFQAPNNKNIEAKIDMTLNFLEYVLATIDDRIEKIDKGDM